MTLLRTVLVDDVAEMRELLRLLLQRDGRFTIVGEAANGQEAIRVVGEAGPDLVVLDVAMPVLDGIAALPKLLEASPGTRIVMLSGFPAEQMERPSLEAGAVGYVEKGPDIGALPGQLHFLATVLGTLQRVLDRTYAPDPSSAGSARRHLRSTLQGKVDGAVLEVVELLTSELVTNVIEHARTTARVTAVMTGSRLRVSVTDEGPGIPTPQVDVSPQRVGGRGLGLVGALSASWGVGAGDVGKTVWFELDV
jgi:DNA-binding NarL/FixJ family response regulator